VSEGNVSSGNPALNGDRSTMSNGDSHHRVVIRLPSDDLADETAPDRGGSHHRAFDIADNELV